MMAEREQIRIARALENISATLKDILESLLRLENAKKEE